MHNVPLSVKDIELLTEALDAWEHAPSADGLSMSIMGLMIGPRGPEHEEERKQAFTKRLKDSDEEAKVRSERAIMLKATLIRAKLQIQEHEVVP